MPIIYTFQKNIITNLNERYRMDKTCQLFLGFVICSSLLLTIGFTSSYGQTSSTIIINATLKEDNFISSDLNLENSTLSFGEGNKICPDNACKIEVQDSTFSTSGNSGTLRGTLKVENKSDSNTNYTSFDFYKLYAGLDLVSSKENVNTGEKILNFRGNLDIDKPEYVTELKYKSQVTETSNSLVLKGNLTE
jgi:hypothetical protein